MEREDFLYWNQTMYPHLQFDEDVFWQCLISLLLYLPRDNDCCLDLCMKTESVSHSSIRHSPCPTWAIYPSRTKLQRFVLLICVAFKFHINQATEAWPIQLSSQSVAWQLKCLWRMYSCHGLKHNLTYVPAGFSAMEQTPQVCAICRHFWQATINKDQPCWKFCQSVQNEESHEWKHWRYVSAKVSVCWPLLPIRIGYESCGMISELSVAALHHLFLTYVYLSVPLQ